MGFIIIDPDTKRPMNASRALALLEETNALEKLRQSGYYADEFRAAVSPPQGGSCLSTSHPVCTNYGHFPTLTLGTRSTMVGGIVGGVIGITASILLLLLVLVGVIMLYKRR